MPVRAEEVREATSHPAGQPPSASSMPTYRDMKWYSPRVGKIAGIGIFVHWTFLLLIAGTVAVHVLRGDSFAIAAGAIARVLAVFACVVLHELGHALAAKHYGIGTHDIILLPIGGVARLERMPDKPIQELWVAAAGPAVNLLIAAVVFCVIGGLFGLYVFQGFEAIYQSILLGGAFLVYLLSVNVSLALFNLLPAFPLDGGRVLRALLATRLDYLFATQIAMRVGQALAVVLFVVGIVNDARFLSLIAVFIFTGAQQEARVARTRTAPRRAAADRALPKARSTLAAWIISGAVAAFLCLFFFFWLKAINVTVPPRGPTTTAISNEQVESRPEGEAASTAKPDDAASEEPTAATDGASKDAAARKTAGQAPRQGRGQTGDTSAKLASQPAAPAAAPGETTVFGPGMLLSLEVGPFNGSELPADFAEQVEARLRKSLETLGCRVEDGQPVRLIATCTEGKTETQQYKLPMSVSPPKFGKIGEPMNETFSVSATACDCRLALLDASGSTIWGASREFRPRFKMAERYPRDTDPATYVQEKAAKEVAVSVQEFFLSTPLPSTKRTRQPEDREQGGAGAAGAAIDRLRAAQERAKTPVEDPNHPDYWKQNLDDMLQGHLAARHKAIERLAKANPEKVPSSDLRKEIARAFRQIAFDRSVGVDPFARAKAVEGLATWGGTFSAPLLIELLESDDSLVRRACYAALANLKDERAIEPVTRRFVGDFAERREAAECLVAFGPKAEDAVLKLARPDDMTLARDTVVLLGKIGTKKSLKALTLLRAQPYFPLIQGEVNLAASAIMLREKEKR